MEITVKPNYTVRDLKKTGFRFDSEETLNQLASGFTFNTEDEGFWVVDLSENEPYEYLVEVRESSVFSCGYALHAYEKDIIEDDESTRVDCDIWLNPADCIKI